LWRNSHKAWEQAKPEPLAPIKLHEVRHTFASLMIAAGVNAKVLSTYMGHSSITITLDRYGHLMPVTRASPPGCSTPTFSGLAHTLARTSRKASK
jgi:integrase